MGYQDYNNGNINGVACVGQQSTPAIAHRYVSSDGISEVEQQDFAYSTNWHGASGIWDSKGTIVTTTDLSRTLQGVHPNYKTSYTYLPGLTSQPPPVMKTWYGAQVPLENTVAYNDWNGSTLKTVTKGWWTNEVVGSEQTAFPNGQTTLTAYAWFAPGVPLEVDEYAFGTGAPGALIRKTVNTYQKFAATPLSTNIYDKPCNSIAYDGSNNRLSEVDYLYDNSSAAVCAPSPTSSLSGTGSYTGHDETLYGSGIPAARGNPTRKTVKCFAGSVACTDTITTFAYDETGQVTSTTDSCGNSACGDMTGGNHTTTFSYSDAYTVLSSGQNKAYSPAVQTNAYATKITDPASHATNASYDFNSGQRTMSTDQNSQSTTFIYDDPLSRPTGITGPDSSHTGYAYVDGVNATVTATNPIGVTAVTVADGWGRTKQTQLTSDPAGTDYTDTTYDGVGNLQSVSNTYRTAGDLTYGITSNLYDALGRKIDQCQPDNSNTNTTICSPLNSYQSWSYSGSTVTLRDEIGSQWQRTTDALGRLIQVLEPSFNSKLASVETDYGYDGLNNLLSVTQKGLGSETPRTRSFTYDSLSRLLCASNPENSQSACPPSLSGPLPAGTMQYAYDANGNVVSKQDARTISTTYGYNNLNQLLSKSYSDGSPSSCFLYGSSPTAVERLANEWTQFGSCPMTLPTSGFITMRSILGYDAMGRAKSEQQCTPGSCTTSLGPQLWYGYNLAGQGTCLMNTKGAPVGATLTTGGADCLAGAVGSPSGFSLTTSFDAAGHMNSLTSNWPTFPTNLYTLPTGSYGPIGPLNWNLGPSLSVTQSYTNRLWVNSIAATGQVPK